MKKHTLSAADHELIAAAIEAVERPVTQIAVPPAPALVGVALRLNCGRIITSVNLIVDVGALSICAEPIAIAEAIREPDKVIETIVAVYHAAGSRPRVISPCGRCRETIADYAVDSFVILREPETNDCFKTKITELLPLRYSTYWRGNQLL